MKSKKRKGESLLNVEFGLLFGTEPFGNELKDELITVDGRISEWNSMSWIGKEVDRKIDSSN